MLYFRSKSICRGKLRTRYSYYTELESIKPSGKAAYPSTSNQSESHWRGRMAPDVIHAQGNVNKDDTNYSSATQESQEKHEEKNKDYLYNMRGWLVTVATLFVTIAFQAAMQPPAWMPKAEEWGRAMWDPRRYRVLNVHERLLVARAAAYQILNAAAFSAAMTIAVKLLVMDMGTLFRFQTRRAMLSVAVMIWPLATIVAASFLLGVTSDWVATAVLLLVMVCVCFLADGIAMFIPKRYKDDIGYNN
ncbi:hypothetical protein ACP4OV_006754 [Aristida adscensionis]